jgi:hypothetical protein
MSYAGDWMAYGRFFLPILPIVILLSFAILSFLKSYSQKRNSKPIWQFSFTGAIVIFLLLNVYQTNKAIQNKEIYPYLVMNSSRLAQLGKWLKQNYPEETVIALRRQGAIPYHSKMKSIDILGLTEREIAKTIHKEKNVLKKDQRNAEWVLNRKPDVIILFSFKSEYKGHVFDKSRSEERLYYIEHYLYRKALQQGYEYLRSFSLGKSEKALILEYSGEKTPSEEIL